MQAKILTQDKVHQVVLSLPGWIGLQIMFQGVVGCYNIAWLFFGTNSQLWLALLHFTMQAHASSASPN